MLSYEVIGILLFVYVNHPYSYLTMDEKHTLYIHVYIHTCRCSPLCATSLRMATDGYLALTLVLVICRP